jgi:bacteriocin-like protein
MTHQPEQENQQIPTAAEVRESPLNDLEANKQVLENLKDLSDKELQAVVGGAGGNPNDSHYDQNGGGVRNPATGGIGSSHSDGSGG